MKMKLQKEKRNKQRESSVREVLTPNLRRTPKGSIPRSLKIGESNLKGVER